ncbi:hypothetical protein LAZ40_09820 [Cereibacter sphaeroides]|uniref:hypothetical protein n=1 Tax=Cereibacter sphaeroides TaxID=1063 RepID=UPI001F1F320B|nr:hypothetical protein [Cereibacter sphaeroides]MCE6959348.1 hypothetical protein [Cereibacter sphaeroides]MCE6972940.1 hypothetical protein [Cereibacter sphaeroides]
MRLIQLAPCTDDHHSAALLDNLCLADSCEEVHMRVATVALIAAFLPAAAGATDLIDCTRKGHNPIRIKIDSMRFEGHRLSCINGDFVADMTPCAPNGWWSLSSPTGDAGIYKVVNRWQDYGDHMGGVVHHWATDTGIHFDGGFMGYEGLKDSWSFTIDRITAKGRLSLEGKSAATYDCKRVKTQL